MNKTVIIFGSAPYYQKIKPFIPELIKKYNTIGINDAQLDFPFKTWAFCDSEAISLIKKVKCFDKAITRKIWESQIPKKYLSKFELFQNAGNTIIHPDRQYETKALAFHLFTISFVLNYVYLKGYKDVYLAGIEHTEGKYDSEEIRNYIYRYKKLVNLYQLDTNSKLCLEKIELKTLL